LSKLDEILSELNEEAAWAGGNDESLNKDELDGYSVQIKSLMLELIGSIDENGREAERTLAKLVQKVEEL